MHIKFLTHGKGQAAKAVGYVTGSTDHRGILRKEVKVLRGNPSMVAQVVDSLRFSRVYTSGVIAWAPDDAPSDQEIEDVLDDFERLSFAGLDPDRVAWTVVLHREFGGGVHLHILVARVDLTTGKCLNIAPPGWKKAFDTLRDYHNLSHGWARPEDPARARAVRQDGFKRLIDASALRAKLPIAPDPKALIGEYLLQRITAGQIGDRADILAALRKAGLEINREGHDYVSVKDPETDKKYRLKGGIYESEFSARRAVESPDRGREEAPREPDHGNHEIARQKFEDIVRKRAEYNRSRFKERVGPPRILPQEAKGRLGEDVENRSDASLVGESVSDPDHDTPLLPGCLADLAGVPLMLGGSPDQRNDFPGRKGLPDYCDAGMDGLPVRPGSVDPLQAKEGVDHDDGARNPIDRIVHSLCRGINNSRQTVGRALERFQRALGKIGSTLSTIERRALKVIEETSTDPNHLMKEVDLVHYAELCGYRIRENMNSKNVVIMDKDEDKLLVVRDTKGTDLYFSLVPPDDGGSFSDFVRKKKALSVGEVRKRMRERKHDLSSSSTPAPPMSREWIENTVRAYRLNPYSGGVLESRWGLLPETVERFREQIREDDKGNVCFLHRNNKGVTGWEILGEDRIEFSERGTHSSFFVGKTGTRILRVVITESALEAMSYFQVRGKEGDCYLSLGGTISRKQLDSLREVAQRFRPVVMVTGGDERGRRLAEEIEREVPGLLQELPSSGRTWNEEIQEERGHSESDAFYRINP